MEATRLGFDFPRVHCMSICTQCKKEYKPSSRHIRCPKCRAENRKQLCKCGKKISYYAKKCIQCEGKERRGRRNPRWKGGLVMTKPKMKAASRGNYDGYMLRHVPEHPRAHCNGGYVLEHVLVMEQILGRFLTGGDNVHHKNGIRNDNRPENLELWTRPQPSGIRVKDAIIWAKGILEKYGNDENKY